MSRFMSRDLMVTVFPADSAGAECPTPTKGCGTTNECPPSSAADYASVADLDLLKADLKDVLGR